MFGFVQTPHPLSSSTSCFHSNRAVCIPNQRTCYNKSVVCASIKVPSDGGSRADVRRDISRRNFLQSALVAAGALSVVGEGATLAPQKALADTNLTSAKRSYFRYVPRFEKGRDYYVLELLESIKKGEWEEILSAFKPSSVAREGSAKAAAGVDQKSTRIERDLTGPMKIWAQAFASKGTGPITNEMLEEEGKLETALKKIERVAKGDTSPLPGTKGPNPNEGKNREEIALVAWEEGKDAINQYLLVANKHLSRELRKVSDIPDDLSTYEKAVTRPQNTF